MKVLEGLYYTKDHEWVLLEDGKAKVGITAYAAESMGDIVYVELPECDEAFEAHDACGVIESVKAAADVYMPISGTVVAINEALEDSPELVNEGPYEAYLFVLEGIDTDDLSALMDANAYKDFIEEA